MFEKIIQYISIKRNTLRTLTISRKFNAWGSGVIKRGFQSNGMSQIYCGKDVTLNEFAWISFDGDKGRLVVEDNVYIGRFCTMSISTLVLIRKSALISDRVFIGDCNHGYANINLPISRQPLTAAGSVEIGEGCWIGIGVAILPGVTIGKNAIIGANSVVTRSIPDYCIAVGNPAKVIRNIAVNPD
jgi:acetyltransferase-like isoleucine patch superfamily enzyme